jgi:predicted nucleic acid-binding Zn ribbon protein
VSDSRAGQGDVTAKDPASATLPGSDAVGASGGTVDQAELVEAVPRPHDPTGLETARALAAGLRGQGAVRNATKRSSRGSEQQFSGARPDARDPALLGSAVEKLVTEHGWDTDLAVHGVFGRWSQIVGSDVAAHCAPESYKDGHLTVRTDSTSWATQLKLLAPTVIRRLNEELGHGTVLHIDVVGPAGPSWRKGNRSVRGARGPRDTYG